MKAGALCSHVPSLTDASQFTGFCPKSWEFGDFNPCFLCDDVKLHSPNHEMVQKKLQILLFYGVCSDYPEKISFGRSTCLWKTSWKNLEFTLVPSLILQHVGILWICVVTS